MGQRLDEIRARRALLPPVTSTNVHASLERGAAAQAAFVAALQSGMAGNATCWSEAADAVLAHAQVADDIDWLIATAVGLFDLRYTAEQERDAALARAERLERIVDALAAGTSPDELLASDEQVAALTARAERAEAERDAALAVLEASDEDADRLWRAVQAAPPPTHLGGGDLAETQRVWDRRKVRAILADLRARAGVTRG